MVRAGVGVGSTSLARSIYTRFFPLDSTINRDFHDICCYSVLMPNRPARTPAPIGFQPYRGTVWICNRSSEADLLANVGRWKPGTFLALDYAEEISEMSHRGLLTVGKRYALTKEGFDRLAEIGWGFMHDQALEMHMSDDSDVPDYVVGGGEKKKVVRKPVRARSRVRVVRPRRVKKAGGKRK